jgi:hypothetical protein
MTFEHKGGCSRSLLEEPTYRCGLAVPWEQASRHQWSARIKLICLQCQGEAVCKSPRGPTK